MQNRQLQRWLNEDEYSQIEAEWEEQKNFREELKDKPDELKRYEDKLKTAIFEYNRAEAYRNEGKSLTAKKFYASSDKLCEEALEILQEIIHEDASMRIWFDRFIDFEHGSLIDVSIGNLPRLVTSRSLDKQRSDSRITKKLDVKISVVERAILNIGIG